MINMIITGISAIVAVLIILILRNFLTFGIFGSIVISLFIGAIVHEICHFIVDYRQERLKNKLVDKK